MPFTGRIGSTSSSVRSGLLVALRSRQGQSLRVATTCRVAATRMSVDQQWGIACTLRASARAAMRMASDCRPTVRRRAG